MKSSAIIAIGVGVVVAASVFGYFSLNQRSGTPEIITNPSDFTVYWICVGGAEPHDFSMTVGEMAKMKVMKCPVCGSEDVFRALPCPSCGKYYPIGRYNASPKECMYCHAKLPGGDISTFHNHGGH